MIRRRPDVTIETLTGAEFALLSALAEQAPLDAACARALAADPTFDLTEALRDHVARGTVVDFH